MKSRDIKFRVWDVDNTCFIRGLSGTLPIVGLQKGNIFRYGDVDGKPLNVSVKLTQFTGLKDKNGVEIYEGDIVQYFDYRERKIISPVIYEPTYFGVLDFNGELGGPNDLYYAEVIGNIFENSKLLSHNAQYSS